VVVCDGGERTHTARLSSFTDVGFRRGPAGADVSFVPLIRDNRYTFRSRSVADHPRQLVPESENENVSPWRQCAAVARRHARRGRQVIDSQQALFRWR
jgi:hypothetical protein